MVRQKRIQNLPRLVAGIPAHATGRDPRVSP
jgi:hypothetical protein